MKNLVLQWNELALEAIRKSKPGPPMAARSLAVIYTAIYDAWAAYDSVAKQTTTNFNAGVTNNEQNLHTSLHYAAYRTLLDQFPGQKELFDKFMLSLNHPISQTSTVLTSASGIGNRAPRQTRSTSHRPRQR